MPPSVEYATNEQLSKQVHDTFHFALMSTAVCAFRRHSNLDMLYHQIKREASQQGKQTLLAL